MAVTWVINPFTGALDAVGFPGAAPFVTSVAGGVGITNSPEPIVGVGTVNLDIDSLTVETVSAANDTFPFYDVSVASGNAVNDQRKITRANILGAELEALRTFASTGIIVRTGAATYVARSIDVTDTATVNLTITDGNGVLANPTLQADVLAAGISGLGFVDGAGAAGQVAFWTDANTIDGEPFFAFDSALQVLAVGTGSEFFDPGIVSGEVTAAANTLTIGTNSWSSRFAGHATSSAQGAGLWAAGYNAAGFGLGGVVLLSRSRGTFDLKTTVANNDELGRIDFLGFDGTDFEVGASIRATVSGIPGSPSDMPGRLSFYTTPDTSATPVERVRVDPDGMVTLYDELLVNPVASASGFVYGGTGVAGNLELQHSTTLDYNNAGGGVIRLHGRIRNSDSWTATQANGRVIQYTSTIAANTDNAGPGFIQWAPTVTSTFNATSASETGGSAAMLAVDAAGTFTKTAAGTDLVNSAVKFQAFETRYVWRYDNAAAGGTQIVGGYQAAHSVARVTGTPTIALLYGFGMSSFSGQTNPDAGGTRPGIINFVGTGCTVSVFAPFWCPDLGYTGTVTELYQFYGEDQTDAVGTRVATFRSRMTTGSGKFGIYIDGTADNIIRGNVRIGDTTVPTRNLEVVARATIHDSDATGLTTAYDSLLLLPLGRTISMANGGVYNGLTAVGTLTWTGTTITANSAFETNGLTYQAGAAHTVAQGMYGLLSIPTIRSGAHAVVATTGQFQTVHHNPTIGNALDTGTWTLARVAGYRALGNMADAGMTVSTWGHSYMQTPTITAGTVGNLVFAEIDDLTSTATAKATIWSKGVTAPLCHAGDGIFGALQTTIVAPSATLHAQESTAITNGTIGGEVLRLETLATNDDPNYRVFHGRQVTTNATVTTLLSFTLTAAQAYLIEARVVAHRTGGAAGAADDSAVYVIYAGAKHTGGVAALIGAIQQGYVDEDQAGWDAIIDVDGANAIRVRVTGAADNNITWHCTLIVQNLGT